MYEDNNKLYNNLSEDIILEKINHLVIPFDKTWKKVSVNLSGGADSALCTYLLCQIIQKYNLSTTIEIITYQRCWTGRPWQGDIAQDVYMWLKNKFPKIIGKRHLCYIPPELEHGVIGNIVNNRSGDMIIVGSFNKFAAYTYGFDAVFNATSKNPSVEEDCELKRRAMDNRNVDVKKAHIGEVWFVDKTTKCAQCHPFKFVEKDWILAQYHMLNILDLLKITRSCEGDINHNQIVKDACAHYTKYNKGMHIPECGECWWCLERNWAMTRVPEMIKEINEF